MVIVACVVKPRGNQEYSKARLLIFPLSNSMLKHNSRRYLLGWRSHLAFEVASRHLGTQPSSSILQRVCVGGVGGGGGGLLLCTILAALLCTLVILTFTMVIVLTDK